MDGLRCRGKTVHGDRCASPARDALGFCAAHQPESSAPTDATYAALSRRLADWATHRILRLHYGAGTGSAVPLQFGDRFFIATAGHCASAIGAGTGFEVSGNQGRLPIRSTRVGSRYRAAENGLWFADFGYVEIPPSDASALQTQGVAFLQREIAIVDRQGIEALECELFVTGFPGAIQSGRPGVISPLMFMGPLAGHDGNPPSVLDPCGDGTQYWDLYINPMPGAYEVIEVPLPGASLRVPNLPGASGAPCWMLPLSDGAYVIDGGIRLVGIHVLSRRPSVSGDADRFAREVAIGHVLRLLADDYADLREAIFHRWPEVRDDRWAPP